MNNLKREHDEVLGDWPQEGVEYVERCPVCGGAERSILYAGLTDNVFYCAPGKWSLYKCGGCGSAYLNPRPTPDTIGLAYVSYFTHSSEASSEISGLSRLRRALANGYRNRKYGTHERSASTLGYWLAMLMPAKRANLDAIMRHLPQARPGDRLLDIGCGNGDFLVRAKDCGWTVVGVEPDSKAAAVARKRGIEVFVSGIESVSSMHGSFTGITLSHVIEHVHEPLNLLHECYQLLKPGGWIWVDTPNLNSQGHRKYGKHWRGLEPPRHLVLFTRASLDKCILSAGFVNIEDMPYRNVCPSLFATSEAISHGHNPNGAMPGIIERIKCLLPGFYAKFNPNAREFITVRAEKSADDI